MIHFSTTLFELFVIKKVLVPTFFRNQDVIYWLVRETFK
ncbi:hypothetical protein LEP1GSC072_4328 [Leptospira noguchii str. Bonito]|nr:hypothetical protein LEP1GSC072_4328 [Leptospira noguchii str. Bonito]